MVAMPNEKGACVDRLNSIRAFVRVGESSSFVRAADMLDLTVSRVSRMVSDLESQLGT